MHEIEFIVQEAGCTSCAALVREALAPIAAVQAIEVDESADCASVRVASPGELRQEDVDRALLEASSSAGHDYRVKPGSWRADSSA